MLKNQALAYYNVGCIACDKIEEEMVKVGCFVVCHECCKSHHLLNEEGCFDPSSPQYINLREKYFEKSKER